MVHKVLFEHYLMSNGKRHEFETCEVESEDRAIIFKGQMEVSKPMEDVVSVVATPFGTFRQPMLISQLAVGDTIRATHTLTNNPDPADWWKDV